MVLKLLKINLYISAIGYISLLEPKKCIFNSVYNNELRINDVLKL